MKSKAVIFTVLLSTILIIGSSPAAWGAQLNAFINPNQPESPFEMKYQRTIIIEYEDGGKLADQLRGKSLRIEKLHDDSNPDVASLKDRINQKLRNDGSATQIGSLTVDYIVELNGRALNTAIDYKLILDGTLTGYNIVEGKGAQKALIDLGWRGMTVQGPVIIDGLDVNQPLAALIEMVPEVGNEITGEAKELLTRPLIDAEGIKNQPMTNWHFLFDPTGINVDASQFGLSEEIKGFVASAYTMGESSIREGRQVEQILEAKLVLDKEYSIRDIQSADNAQIKIIGFSALDKLDNLEIAGVTPKPPEGYATTSTGGFPVTIIYGMAALAAIGGGVFFMFSNRALKKEAGMGQQGIDPSRLTAYQTSSSAGGYQTNRAEAQLTDAADYQQHRSVYDQQQSQPQDETTQSTRGSMPKGWKKD